MKPQPLTQLASIIAILCASPAVWAEPVSTNVGTVTVQGTDTGGTESGLIIQEETPKARSSVNRKHLDKLDPSSNPYQAIELLPGVNTFSYDATGLFGGGLRIRGFNSDQLGFTINGAPVNDSGNFAVYPQEYTDSENLCEMFVTQGSTDTDAPHVGATGGNVGMVTCGPNDQRRVRVSQSAGQLNYTRTFVRYDTGAVNDGQFKAFVSYSKSKVDKFKGKGGADRDHVDLGAEMKLGANTSVSTSFLYNRAFNNNYRTLTKAQIAATGRMTDFGLNPPQHLAGVNGTAQVESAPSDGFYKFSVNPFENSLWTAKLEHKIDKDWSVSAEPYYWYGFGTGGNQLTTLAESNVGTKLGGGIRDINGDGDALDTVMVYRSSVTKTHRPGITLKSSYRMDNHLINAGFWFERANHRQTQPATTFDNNGNALDPWLANPANFLLRQDGTAYQGRDQLTISKAQSLFVQDSISLMSDQLNLVIGLKAAKIDRDFENYANESTSSGRNSGADYQVKRSYSKVLPNFGLRYALNEQQSVFFNAAQNFKAPGNFSFQNLLAGGAYTSGVLSGFTQQNPVVKAETSNNYDLGYRIASGDWTFSGSVFHIDYQNRIASGYNPDTGTTFDINVGDVRTQGAELESGFRMSPNWSLYGSLSYVSSKMKSDLRTGASTTEATAGKQLPDTPNWLAGIALNYVDGPFFSALQAKYTGKAYSTLVNDEQVDGYTVINLATGYRFESGQFFKNPMIRLNVSNLFDTEYLRINSGSGSQFTTRALGAGGSAPAYYVGAPRFASVTLSSDF